MCKKTTYEIEIPFFCGYYESPLYSSDDLYCEVHENLEEYKERYNDPDLTEDDLDIDFDEFRNDVNRKFISAFRDEMDNAMEGFIKEIAFSDMTSPKYYNFETDRLFANVVLCDDWQERVLGFMEDNKEWLSKRIERDWTSRDGFWSHMDNTYAEWLERMSADEPDWLYLSVMLGYILYRNNKDVRDDLIYYAKDDIWVGAYIVNLKEERENKVLG